MSAADACSTPTGQVREEPLIGVLGGKASSDQKIALLLVAVAGSVVVVGPGPFTALAFISLFLLPVTAKVTHYAPHRNLSFIIALWLVLIGVSSVLHSEVRWSTLFTGAYPLMILATAIAFSWLSRNDEKKLLQIAVSVGVAMVAGSVIQPIGVGDNDRLKAGLGSAILLLIFAVLSLKVYRPMIVLIVCFTVGIAFFLLDFRNPALTSLATGITIFLIGRRRRKRTVGLVLAGFAILAGAAFITASVYSNLATQGSLGIDAQNRIERQTTTSGGLLLGARPEIAVSIEAISNDFWLGRGGSPKATLSERNAAINNLEKAGLDVSARQVNRLVGQGINSHSLVFTAWVTHGILGAFMWLLIVGWLWVGAFNAVIGRTRMAPLMLFGALQMTWDALFSPWSPRAEIMLGLYCALAAFTMLKPQQRTEVETLEKTA